MTRLLALLFVVFAFSLTANAQSQITEIHDPACFPLTPASESDETSTKTSEPRPVSFLTPPQPYHEERSEGFHWRAAIEQSLIFLAVQHTFRMTEEKTRRELGGPFFKDWFDAVKSTHGWDDGGRQFTNYVAHPMQGAFNGYIQIQNDPKGIGREFNDSKAYWKSRLKAMGWAAIWSTQFELGPLSQASIGNVGAGKYEAKKMAYVDLVITPTMGFTWIVAEDAVDHYVIEWIERRTQNRFVRNAARMFMNPVRSCANVIRFKPMWHRDTRL